MVQSYYKRKAILEVLDGLQVVFSRFSLIGWAIFALHYGVLLLAGFDLAVLSESGVKLCTDMVVFSLVGVGVSMFSWLACQVVSDKLTYGRNA